MFSCLSSESIIIDGKSSKKTFHKTPLNDSYIHGKNGMEAYLVNLLDGSRLNPLSTEETGAELLSFPEEVLTKKGYLPVNVLIQTDYENMTDYKDKTWLIPMDDPSGRREIGTWLDGPIGVHVKETLWTDTCWLSDKLKEIMTTSKDFYVMTNETFDVFYVSIDRLLYTNLTFRINPSENPNFFRFCCPYTLDHHFGTIFGDELQKCYVNTLNEIENGVYISVKTDDYVYTYPCVKQYMLVRDENGSYKWYIVK